MKKALSRFSLFLSCKNSRRKAKFALLLRFFLSCVLFVFAAGRHDHVGQEVGRSRRGAGGIERRKGEDTAVILYLVPFPRDSVFSTFDKRSEELPLYKTLLTFDICIFVRLAVDSEDIYCCTVRRIQLVTNIIIA